MSLSFLIDLFSEEGTECVVFFRYVFRVRFFEVSICGVGKDRAVFFFYRIF